MVDVDRLGGAEVFLAIENVLSGRAAARHSEAKICHSDRSRKHMQIRADEVGLCLEAVRRMYKNMGGRNEG